MIRAARTLHDQRMLRHRDIKSTQHYSTTRRLRRWRSAWRPSIEVPVMAKTHLSRCEEPASKHQSTCSGGAAIVTQGRIPTILIYPERKRSSDELTSGQAVKEWHMTPTTRTSLINRRVTSPARAGTGIPCEESEGGRASLAPCVGFMQGRG